MQFWSYLLMKLIHFNLINKFITKQQENIFKTRKGEYNLYCNLEVLKIIKFMYIYRYIYYPDEISISNIINK